MSAFTEYFDALGEYSGPGALEVELRFLVDSRFRAPLEVKQYSPGETREMVTALLKRYPGTIEQTINFIAGENIKQMLFIRGEQQKDKAKYYSKRKIADPIYLIAQDRPSYRIGANIETEIPEFPLSHAQLARIKCRHSATHADFEGWRLDITLVKTVENFGSNPTALKDAKNKMLFALESADFANLAPFDMADMIEIELEYIGELTALNTTRLNVADIIFAPANTNASTVKKNPAALAYQAAIYCVAQYIKPRQAARFKSEYGLKQLGNKVIELDKRIYMHDVQITSYYMCDKNDGQRAILYLAPNGSCALTDKYTTLPIKTDTTYIFDSEFIDGRYVLFDVMVWEGIQLLEPFKKRLEYFDQAAKLSELFETKPFIRLTDNYAEQIKQFKAEPKIHATDGLVLTPADEQYETMKVYKYKPLDHLTVDFLVKKCPSKLLGIEPFARRDGQTLYLLFCGISRQVFIKLRMSFVKHYEDIFPEIDPRDLPRYFPYQFSPSDTKYAYLYYGDDNLDGEVCEFKNSPAIIGAKHGSQHDTQHDMQMWVLNKIRTDRRDDVARGGYFGNDYAIAEKIWFSYKTPLVIEDLKESSGYFAIHDNVLQKTSRNFNNYVKSELFKSYSHLGDILDIASGKGQDLFRYGSIHTKHLSCVEIDHDAIFELIYRKHDFARADGSGMSVTVSRVDINESYKRNIEILRVVDRGPESCDVVMCNLAFHYFLESPQTIRNVIHFIDYFLKPGGRFIFTAYDGHDVLGLLNMCKGNYTITNDNNDIIYSIKAKYSTNTLANYGQKIDVMLPFSTDYYSEYMVNIDYIAEEFAKNKIILESKTSYADHLTSYPNVQSMTAEDKKYVGLYHIYTFYKTIPKGGREKKQAARFKIVKR
jgi:SAM-dependent methyltransferase